MELQTLKLFFNDVADNIFPNGTSSGYPQIYCGFVKSLTKPLLNNPPTTPGSETNSDVPTVRLMQLHGWIENWEHFAHLERQINQYKANVSGLLPLVLLTDPTNSLTGIFFSCGVKKIAIRL